MGLFSKAMEKMDSAYSTHQEAQQKKHLNDVWLKELNKYPDLISAVSNGDKTLEEAHIEYEQRCNEEYRLFIEQTKIVDTCIRVLKEKYHKISDTYIKQNTTTLTVHRDDFEVVGAFLRYRGEIEKSDGTKEKIEKFHDSILVSDHVEKAIIRPLSDILDSVVKDAHRCLEMDRIKVDISLANKNTVEYYNKVCQEFVERTARKVEKELSDLADEKSLYSRCFNIPSQAELIIRELKSLKEELKESVGHRNEQLDGILDKVSEVEYDITHLEFKSKGIGVGIPL